MRVGATAKIDNITLRVEEITDDGERIVALDKDVDLYAGGSMPLPPYISRASDEKDTARYQTVFARCGWRNRRAHCRSSFHRRNSCVKSRTRS